MYFVSPQVDAISIRTVRATNSSRQSSAAFQFSDDEPGLKLRSLIVIGISPGEGIGFSARPSRS
eukprot:scaffold1973_cov399-Prasinococcus_capsulatus_cf.AAC.32